MGGIIELFSQHLYSTPKVFIRELLQNAADALTARRMKNPDAECSIDVYLTDDAAGKIIKVKDTGIGLTLEEIHKFLSIIGESSKRLEFTDDFIGHFGVGLLSGFLVSDNIELYTRSEADRGYLWKAMQNGTYTIEEAEVEEIGSTVVLRCKQGFEEYFEPELLTHALKFYGDILPYPITFHSDDETAIVINETLPPWLTPYSSDPSKIIDFGEDCFGEKFMGYIPLKSEIGGVRGVAYISAHRVNPAANSNHRVYLHNMLISETGKGILPKWAFFVRAVVNTRHLTPTASREDFYEDSVLEKTRDELGKIIKDYIIHSIDENPSFIDAFMSEHNLALKSVAVDDEEILESFIDLFQFETSLGHYSFKEIRNMTDTVRYVSEVDRFRQVSSIFSARGILLVNAGYVYDEGIMDAASYLFEDISFEKMSPEDILFEMEPLSESDSGDFSGFARDMNRLLRKWSCGAEIKRFAPAELPALLLFSDTASFISDLRYAKEHSSDALAGILESIDNNFANTDTVLCFNANNILVKKLAENGRLDSTTADLLYAQSLLMARRPLRVEEMNALNKGIIKLIERAL
jgi:molecular chaperone HtpG